MNSTKIKKQPAKKIQYRKCKTDKCENKIKDLPEYSKYLLCYDCNQKDKIPCKNVQYCHNTINKPYIYCYECNISYKEYVKNKDEQNKK